MIELNQLRINQTRFEGMGFARVGNVWRFIDTDADNACVGPHYARKDELLADLTRYATEYGCALKGSK